jgi:hypothetical protein
MDGTRSDVHAERQRHDQHAPAVTDPQRTFVRGWDTLGLMSFSGEDLAALTAAEEVRIETQAPGGPVHRTIIWIAVEGDEVYIRSVRGPRGRWFREAQANPAIAIQVNGRRLPATAIPATDPASIERASKALARKYALDPALRTMLIPETLDTTLRVEPA